MRLQAEVHCYHCGHVSGTWEWPTGQPEHGRFVEAGGGRRQGTGLLRALRCQRCQGPVFLDAIAPVVAPPVVAFPRVRRGRPPKQSRPLAS
jgi:hypothetical protein